MRGRALVMLGLALVLALAAVILARAYLASRDAPTAAPEGMPLSTVVVANVPLDFGNRIGKEHLREVEWPTATVPAGAFNSIDEVVKPGEERVALRPIERGEPILQAKVSGFGGRATLSSVIDPDMRAMTIRVNDVSGVAGFLLPGERVDVLLTRRGDVEETVTQIILQNVKVLAVDQIASDRQDKPVVVRAVTVEVTPVGAQKLTLAQSVGQLTLTLRHTANNAVVAGQAVGIGDLGTGRVSMAAVPVPVVEAPAAPATAKAPAPAPRSFLTDIVVIRGITPTLEKVINEREAATRPAALSPNDRATKTQ